MYKLFTDKTELFECSISLQGASLKKSKARLVIETPEYSLLFNGLKNNEMPNKRDNEHEQNTSPINKDFHQKTIKLNINMRW